VSSRQRIVLLALAAVVLVAGIALAASSGGDDEPGGDGARPGVRDQANPAGGGGETSASTQERPAPRVDSIRIRDGRPAGGVRTFRYERGDVIRLRIAADAPGEVHIHGFDREVAVDPSGARMVRMRADLEGIFEVEEHDSGELLARLEIRPR
jgi:hypothetical protein